MRSLLIIVPFLMAAINIPFINWSVNWASPIAMGICLGLGIGQLISEIMEGR